jgi:UPF0271 protein
MNFKNYTLNCDLGEGVDHETLIIPWIDVASIACGGHFGDRNTIQTSLDLVRKFKKEAGAHPSYPDQENFGRKTLNISHEELIDSISEQLNMYEEITTSRRIPMDHIKFHGALYNDAALDPELAEVLVIFLKLTFPDIPLFVPPHSELQRAASRHGLPIRLEIFGDRAYLSDYQLVDRSKDNSLFTQTAQVMSHLESILLLGQIKTYSGHLISVHADTLCFHGDNPGILEFLPLVRERFFNYASL